MDELKTLIDGYKRFYKKFFEEQKFVNFSKNWFYHD